ncbi:hydrolase [Kushneria aurantia]|uniref:Hydrolase n=1 Tax=Kushneria aurantia TaxID=504092 RepID=A0ABV6G419_9GAMM|nr:hydrolase [Kushneria aurantia]
MPRITTIKADFRPPPGLTHRHVQTLLPLLLPRAPLQFETELLALPDGDEVELCWANGAPEDARAPIMVLFHGLEGSVYSPYARALSKMAIERGWRTVVMHFRGCGRVPNRMARSYHAGDTADGWWLLSTLGRRYPNAHKVAVGVSLGANMLLKLASEQGGDGLDLAGAIAISPPLDLAACADAINQGFSRYYQRHMLASMKRKVAAHIRDGRLDRPGLEQLRRIDTFWAFDNEVTAPLHGFRSATDYYQRASAGPLLDRIELPTLILHAADDPLMPNNLFDRVARPSPSVRIELAEHGGHVGFIEMRHGLLRSWLARRVGEQLDSWRYLLPGQTRRSDIASPMR